MIAEKEQLLTEENVSIEVFEKSGETYLHFIFKNKFDLVSAQKATKVWSDFSKKDANSKMTHIWDCQSMHGFDNSAKNLWMEHLNDDRYKPGKIYLVSNNIMIRGAARIMTRFSQLPLSIHKSLQEID